MPNERGKENECTQFWYKLYSIIRGKFIDNVIHKIQHATIIHHVKHNRSISYTATSDILSGLLKSTRKAGQLKAYSDTISRIHVSMIETYTAIFLTVTFQRLQCITVSTKEFFLHNLIR